MEFTSVASPSVSSSTSLASTAPSSPIEPHSLLSDLKRISSNAAYTRWRPSYHLQPVSGWLNDPCAPFYNAKTGLYHVSFQRNPHGPDWGDICWGSATSPDLLHWHLEAQPSLKPETAYDCEGVFTGCLMPPSNRSEEDEILTVAYTSVNQVPIHYTFPHIRGSESLSLAQSFDGGETWHKHPRNPIIPHEPEDLIVTGWRDPFVAPWRSMSELFGFETEETMFGIVSGGIRDVTPTTFLYEINRKDLTSWRYVGPLVDVGNNFSPSRWSGDLGTNWEVVNFVTLPDGNDTNVKREFLVMGAEGCLLESDCDSGHDTLTRPARCQLWMSGSLEAMESDSPSASSVAMSPNAVGYLDHGCFYAANSFHDPITNKHVAFGWITEDDLCDDLRHKQGWSGLLSLPRELRMQTIQHVLGARKSQLQDITSIEMELEQPSRLSEKLRNLYTIRTLASEPVDTAIKALRDGPDVRRSSLGISALAKPSIQINTSFGAAQLQTMTWELDCTIKVSPGCREVGLVLRHSLDGSNSTTLTFSPGDETFSIFRPTLLASGSDELINNRPERAPHTLFTLLDVDSGKEVEETLDIRMWRDNSVLEVFINGRTAISTRIYGGEDTFGIQFFANDAETSQKSVLEGATLWDGIGLSQCASVEKT